MGNGERAGSPFYWYGRDKRVPPDAEEIINKNINSC